MEEAILLATRTSEGLDLDAWRRDFGAPFMSGREAAIERLAAAGLIECDGHVLRLTLRGMEVQDAVVLELIG